MKISKHESHQPLVSIITVSYNCRSYLEKMLLSLKKFESTQLYEMIVVDNASNDDTIQFLKSNFPWVQVIQNKANVGFAVANNIGANHAKEEYLWFLNPDVEFIEPTISSLIKLTQDNLSIGAIAPTLLYADRSYQQQGGSLPTLFLVVLWMFGIDDIFPIPSYQMKRKPTSTLEKRGWIGGTALMIAKKTFTKLQGWSESYFMYGEDVDLCYRLQIIGLHAALTNQVSLIHHQNKSSSSKHAIVGEFKGLCIFWKLYKPAWQLSILKAILWFGAWLRIQIFGILYRDETKKLIYREAQKTLALA